MKRYVCSICGFIYDETKEKDLWENLPAQWLCPLCGAPKSAFKEEIGEEKTISKTAIPEFKLADSDFNALEISTVCSNLARSCEKQYMFEESQLFLELADYFRLAAKPETNASFERLLEFVDKDIQDRFIVAKKLITDEKDRGALRSLVWSEKVTNMLNSLLIRYNNDGDKWLNENDVYVCSICGFIYVGSQLPQLCPVCKVPNWKFEKIEGGAK